MVNLVEEWMVLEKYAGDKQGFKKQFENKAAPLLNRILGFCRSRKYIGISESVRDEFFFK